MLAALAICVPVMGQAQKAPVERVQVEQAATVEKTAELANDMFQLAGDLMYQDQSLSTIRRELEEKGYRPSGEEMSEIGSTYARQFRKPDGEQHEVVPYVPTVRVEDQLLARGYTGEDRYSEVLREFSFRLPDNELAEPEQFKIKDLAVDFTDEMRYTWKGTIDGQDASGWLLAGPEESIVVQISLDGEWTLRGAVEPAGGGLDTMPEESPGNCWYWMAKCVCRHRDGGGTCTTAECDGADACGTGDHGTCTWVTGYYVGPCVPIAPL